MEEKEQNPRPQIPVWGWLLGIIGIVLLVQYLTTSSSFFNNTGQASATDVVSLLRDDKIEEMTVTGNRVKITLKEPLGTELGSELQGQEELTWDRDPQLSIYEEFEYRGLDETGLQNLPSEIPDRSAMQGLFNLFIGLGPILLIIWLFSRGFRQIQGGGSNSIFGFGRSRAKNINEGDRPVVTFDDVAGVDEAKEDVNEIVQFLREPERFIQVGARIPKGVLMVGPPGTGKTLLARAIAGEAGVPFYHISGSEFVEMFVGVGASRVRDLFNKAKESAPAIVFVDEIDAVGRQRGAGLGGGNDEREQTLNQILTEMDGFDKDTNVIVIAATNRPDVLDPALLRPGRFDRKVIVDLPDIKGREAILKVHARGKPIANELDFHEWARLTAGFAGADLENLVNEAAINAARNSQQTVKGSDFQEAFDRVVLGPERRSRVIREDEREVLAYHEAGHAVVSYGLTNTDPVQKITIVPRGRAGGFVMSLPSDRMMQTKEYFEDQIAMALGGRAAEEVFFGQVTTGASNDLQQATKMARAMVTQYGFSDELGLRTYGEQSGNVFLGRDFNSRDYSEDAASKIDGEVRDILEENYNRAKKIIGDNRDRIVNLVNTLLDVETMDRPAFEKLMNA